MLLAACSAAAAAGTKLCSTPTLFVGEAPPHPEPPEGQLCRGSQLLSTSSTLKHNLNVQETGKSHMFTHWIHSCPRSVCYNITMMTRWLPERRGASFIHGDASNPGSLRPCVCVCGGDNLVFAWIEIFKYKSLNIPLHVVRERLHNKQKNRNTVSPFSLLFRFPHSTLVYFDVRSIPWLKTNAPRSVDASSS